MYSPTFEIDKALGTKLYTEYEMHGGKTSADIETYLISTNSDAKVLKLYKDLIKLNPQLDDIVSDDLYDIIFGAVSGFTYDDIKYWVNDTDSRGFANIDPSYKARVIAATGKIRELNDKYSGGYLPSPTSLKIIETALKSKTKK